MVKDLKEFLLTLNPKQRKFFWTSLPLLIDDWFHGAFGPKDESKQLKLLGSSRRTEYHDVDALAVALLHLKAVYPMTVRAPIYRSIWVPKALAPKGDKLVLTGQAKFKPLQSWTYRSTPHVVERRQPGGSRELILELMPDKANALALTDHVRLTEFAGDAIKLLKDRQVGALEYQVPSIKLITRRWETLVTDLGKIKKEREVLLYIDGSKRVSFGWRFRDR